MKKTILILITLLTGYANADIINLKCSNSKSDIGLMIDTHEKVAWLDNFIPLYVLEVTPEYIRGYFYGGFTTDELKTITNTILTARLETFYKKSEQFEINRSTLDFYSRGGIAAQLKGHGKCTIINNNKI
jgi:hypothetical protein